MCQLSKLEKGVRVFYPAYLAMKHNDYIYSVREFLNEDPSKTAAVAAVVPGIRRSLESDFYVAGSIVGFPVFSISDCTSTISLDYSYFGEKEGREAVAKARKLAHICKEFADALEKQLEDGLEHERRTETAAEQVEGSGEAVREDK